MLTLYFSPVNYCLPLVLSPSFVHPELGFQFNKYLLLLLLAANLSYKSLGGYISYLPLFYVFLVILIFLSIFFVWLISLFVIVTILCYFYFIFKVTVNYWCVQVIGLLIFT